MKEQTCHECKNKFQYDEISLYDGVEFLKKEKGYKEKHLLVGWRKVGRSVDVGFGKISLMCRKCERIYREGIV